MVKCVVCVYEFLGGVKCAEEMGCGRRWVIWVLQGTGNARSVMKDFTVDVLTIPAGILFQNGTPQY